VVGAHYFFLTSDLNETPNCIATFANALRVRFMIRAEKTKPCGPSLGRSFEDRYPDVVFVSDLLARVDVNEKGHWYLFSLSAAPKPSYLVRCGSMASQAVSASANVLKGEPPTLIAGLLIWIGRQEATKPGLP
jgi:hypothetical protein